LGQQPLTTQRVNLNAIVRNVVSQVQHDATLASNAPEWHIDDLPDVVCDNTLMRQVFWNLVSNAAKFSRNNLRPVIEIGQSTKDDDHAFFVRDNGVGFDMKDAGTLFRLFRRLHSDEVFEGIGVGLANVRRIVEKHGGSVWATGAPGQGACFYFTLPSDLPETVL
jgi:light-regulated signal transduction histidine kinase (bacteriophytochrome)